MHPRRLHPILGLIAALAFAWPFSGLHAQTCRDTIQYVTYKNIGGTGGYVLVAGTEESASQAYHLTSAATLKGIRVHGTRLTGLLEMRAMVFGVNSVNQPTSAIDSTAWSAWGAADQSRSYKDFTFNRALADSFACVIQMRTVSGSPQFQLTYNGDGDGRGENLAYVAGPSTGGVWQGILAPPRNRNGDLYILPVLDFNVNSLFNASTYCTDVGEGISIVSQGIASICTDSMMNTSLLAGYIGTFSPLKWIAPGATFTAGSATSHNPTVQYASPGCNSLQLITTFDGWTSFCADTSTITLSVGLNVSLTAADSTQCNPANAGYSPDGALHLMGSGGCPNYQFYLSLSGAPIDTLSTAGAVTFAGLAPGSYQVIAADASPMMGSGCRDTATFSVSAPEAIIISSTTTMATCGLANGSATITAIGGTGSLSYSVDGGPGSASNVFTGLAGGAHLFSVTDANGCSVSATINIPSNDGPSLVLDSTVTTTCPGSSDGAVHLSATGGVGWILFTLDTFPPQATGAFLSVPPGTYTAYAIDATSCIDSVAGIVVSQPPPFTRTIIIDSVSCNGLSDGSITLSGSAGGTGSHEFSLNGGPFTSSFTFTSLASGSYTIVTRDARGCTDTLVATVGQPDPLVIDSLDVHHLTCNASLDGSIEVFAGGGTPSYMYQINASVFFSGNLFASLNFGSYLMTVRDVNGCLVDTTVTITQPPVINATITPTSTTCGGSVGSIFAVGSGGSGGGYTYSIDSVTFVTPGIFTGLPAGSYFVWVRDGNGCMRRFSTNVLNTGGPTITSHSSTNITCNGYSDGTITVNTVTGGAGVLQYSVDGGSYSTSPAFSGLPAGIHDVVVRDGLGCTDTLEIELFEPAPILILPTLYGVACNGGDDGAISIFAAGGVGGFQYSLDGAFYQPVPFFTGLTAGTYTIHVRDGGGCSSTLDVIITESPAISTTATWTDVSCFGDNDGTITVSAFGGAGPLEYSLDGSSWQDSTLFIGLDGGPYFVQVRDSNLCIDTLPVVVGEPSMMALAATIDNASDCASASDGTIDLIVVGGNAPYAYSWTGPGGFTSAAEDPTGIPVGFYVVAVSDSMGCSALDTFEVTCLAGTSNPGMSEFSIYPNPASEHFFISSTSLSDFQYELIDMRGVILLRGRGFRIEEIQVNDLPAGSYLAKVTLDDRIILRRLVLE